MTEHFIGLMSGTSVDGVDAVLIAFEEDCTMHLERFESKRFSEKLRQSITALMLPGENEIERASCVAVELAELYADTIQPLLEGSDPRAIAAIGCHGQTVRHAPEHRPPYTVQLVNGAVLAERTAIPVITDFRAADIAAGGQGAPLAPAFHRAAFQAPNANRVVVNIGGIANATHLPGRPGQPVIGFDTGPGNTLLDAWSTLNTGQTMDRNGAWALSGSRCPELLQRLLQDPYFGRPPPKSTGRETFHLGWLQAYLCAQPNLAAADVQATLVQLTAQSIWDAVRQFMPVVDAMYVCGGGANNPALMGALQQCAEAVPVATTARLGLAPQWVEAAAFGWLAWRTLHGRPGNLPSVTGATREVVLGAIHPAAGPRERETTGTDCRSAGDAPRPERRRS